jgi:hypothetical protein
MLVVLCCLSSCPRSNHRPKPTSIRLNQPARSRY